MDFIKEIMSNLTQLIVDLILQPGSSLKLVPVINVVILALLVLMTYLLYTKIAVIHIIIMSTLAVGLLLSVNWYVNKCFNLEFPTQLTFCQIAFHRFYMEFQKVTAEEAAKKD